jgi:hypothetical protein
VSGERGGVDLGHGRRGYADRSGRDDDGGQLLVEGRLERLRERGPVGDVDPRDPEAVAAGSPQLRQVVAFCGVEVAVAAAVQQPHLGPGQRQQVGRTAAAEQAQAAEDHHAPAGQGLRSGGRHRGPDAAPAPSTANRQ